MKTLLDYRLGPERTPALIKQLIGLTCAVTLGSALLQSLFLAFSLLYGPQEYLSLSWWGISNWYIWQFFTFFFVQWLPTQGITFLFLITLFFNMYVIWMIGSIIVENIGKGTFLALYFLSGFFAACLALIAMTLSSQYVHLAGPGASILALITVWAMLQPELEFLLFFLIPVKAKWFVAGIIGAILLTTLSQGDFVNLTYYLGGILFGYLFAVIIWGLKSPIPFMHNLEDHLSNLGRHFRKKGNAKIIDINTGDELENDERFVDAMLTKIAKHGEKSLTRSERLRLQKISEKRQNNR